MLAIQYPALYRSTFEPLCDFEVFDMKANPIGMLLPGNKELWFDYSEMSTCDVDDHPRDGTILPRHYPDPGTYLTQCARYRSTESERVIAIWEGDRAHLRMLQAAVDLVALPWWKHRNLVITPEEAYEYHAYEFSNLDELRRYPYRSLHTSVPITAAAVGIDLTTRDRRPKRLPPFSYQMVLSEAQLELAYKNCQAIKEAMEHARRNSTLHTD